MWWKATASAALLASFARALTETPPLWRFGIFLVAIFAGPGAGTIGDVWKGRIVSIEQLGEDLRVEVAA